MIKTPYETTYHTANLLNNNKVVLEQVFPNSIISVMSGSEKAKTVRKEENGYAHIKVTPYTVNKNGFKEYDPPIYVYVTSSIYSYNKNDNKYYGITLDETLKKAISSAKCNVKVLALDTHYHFDKILKEYKGCALLDKNNLLVLDKVQTSKGKRRFLINVPKWDYSIRVYSSNFEYAPKGSKMIERVNFSYLQDIRYNKYFARYGAITVIKDGKETLCRSFSEVAHFLNLSVSAISKKWQRSKTGRIIVGEYTIIRLKNIENNKNVNEQLIDNNAVSSMGFKEVIAKKTICWDTSVVEQCRSYSQITPSQSNKDTSRRLE